MTARVQCISCRIVGRAPLLHSCAEVTLQRAGIVAENARAAKARVLNDAGRETSGEEFELVRVAE